MIKQLIMLTVLLLTVHVQQSAQLRSSHPAYDAVRRVNDEIEGAYIGLLMAFPTEEMALIASGLFVANCDVPWVDLAGRRFNVGKIKGVDVIYVMSGELTLNAGMTVQILVDMFDLQGVVHYGIAGSSSDSLNVGDVSIMEHAAFTGSWKWKEFESDPSKLTELKIGDYNFPRKGENLLGRIKFTPQQLYTNENPMQEVFWLDVEPDWFRMAASLKALPFAITAFWNSYAQKQKPKLVAGLRGATAHIFVDNAAFRDFLFRKFNVSTVDEESSAVVMTCLSNGVPCIVFRGISDTAGGGYNRRLSELSLISLAAVNVFNVAVEFIALFGNKGHKYSFQPI